ncbi:MAG: glycosyl hydrolase [Gemmatimonadota bacterium]
MSSTALRSTFALLLLFGLTPPLHAQRSGAEEGSSSPPSDSAVVGSLKARSIGPAVMSGRVVDIAVASSPGSRGGSLGTVFYVAAASGGVWKTTNGGVSFTPVFDDSGVASIGAVAVAPSNSEIVWVGTGEANNQRSSSYGNGVYRSLDGGETFQYMGLRTSQHVGRILVHPTDPDIVYVAAVGPLWSGGGERGVFRTTDGGMTWKLVLPGENAWTGATDLVMDPTDPDILYAATLQRERRAYSYVGGGPGSGIWKSTDGGDTWTRLTRGLPKADMGRIGLGLAASQPRTVYAVIESNDEAGVYRTDNGGASWKKMSDQESIPWYFGHIRVDPSNPEVVYHLGVPLSRSVDGGRTWKSAARRGVHVDHHALWINPENPDHLILGNDGGLYVTHDRGESWEFAVNLPISQFYAVGFDMAEPFFGVYGGLQDNSTWGGPTRTRAAQGVFNSDWFRMAGGDGFYAAVDPTDPNIAYVESQYGFLVRYDKRTGDRRPIRPVPPEGEPAYRFNWSAPVKISPWDHKTIYFAANYLFKSPDRGDTWIRLGEDLTRSIDRDSLPMMGKIPGDDAVSRHQGTAVFSNISTIDISEIQEGLLVTGSDDGTIAISSDDGATWKKQTRFPGVPDTAYVSRVRLSKHDPNVIYATFDNHRSNDFHPYVIRSTNQGKSWENITHDLPEFGSVRAFAEHHANPDLLFVGTEFAAYVSFDRGGSWTRLSNGMPPARVDDIKIHPGENTLVIATHGRGIFLVDDLTPLEKLAEAKAAAGPYLFPVKSDLQFTPDPSRTSGTTADRDFRVPNPPVGTTISYYLPRRSRGVRLEILGADGSVVRTLKAPAGAGLHRVHWDFRVDAPYSGPPRPGRQTRRGGFGGFGGGGNAGAPAVPGMYSARLTAGDAVQEAAFNVEKDDNVALSDAELRRLFDLRMRQMRLNARLTMALRQADELRQAVADAKAAMKEVEVAPALAALADSVADEVADIRKKLGAGGGGFFGGEEEEGPATVRQLLTRAAGMHRATAMPTAQEREALEAAPGALDEQVARLNALVTERVPAFFHALDEAGVPWSPGRPIR